MRDIVNYVSLKDLVRHASEFGTLFLYTTVDVSETIVRERSQKTRKLKKRKMFSHEFVAIVSSVVYIGGNADDVEEGIGRWLYKTRIGLTETAAPDDDAQKHFSSHRMIFDKLAKMIEDGEFEGIKAVEVRRGTLGGQQIPGMLDFDTGPLVASLQKDAARLKKASETPPETEEAVDEQEAGDAEEVEEETAEELLEEAEEAT